MKNRMTPFMVKNATPPPWEDFHCPIFGFEQKKFLDFLDARAAIVTLVAAERDGRATRAFHKNAVDYFARNSPCGYHAGYEPSARLRPFATRRDPRRGFQATA